MGVQWDMDSMDWRALFEQLHPGFFEQDNIRALPEGGRWEELALSAQGFDPGAPTIPVPGDATFGFYAGDMDALRAEVRRVDAGWPALFDGKNRVYCGYAGGALASFCLVEDMGVYRGLRVGGPGCVGTLPEHRRKGIGLRMVQEVTAILKAEGYDISYIHFTGVGPWYARLGYETVLRWGREGIVGSK